ncbi:hypothetical protein JG687_00002737 [Phytophthora cactorum]|uniref:Uncharacterized protein n=1 Tax=Phytophthora cactorum TaxID=29920 RepID=A0A8T1UXL1_9STRA|nr:hypothetical protein JG687_00002737 [Phytophthora cactorum]
MGIATVVTAADAQQGKENMGVTFAETIEHLGGLPVLGGAVLLLALAYIALVEWLMPRLTYWNSGKHVAALALGKCRLPGEI